MPQNPRRPVDELRILHWNVHSWKGEAGASNVATVAALIRETNAHAVSLVEVDETWGDLSALDDLADRVGYASIFVPAFEFGSTVPKGGFGNALLSSLPILAVRQRHLLWPPPVFAETEQTEPRSVLFVKCQTHAGPLWLGTTHLPRTDEAARQRALIHLAEAILALDEPWLIVGDFNTPPSTWLGEHPDWRASPQATPTYPTSTPTEPIDYAIALRQLPVQAEVLDATGSDHLPVLLRARI